VGSWATGTKEGAPRVDFYDNGGGFIHLGDDAWDHLSGFFYDAERGDYRITSHVTAGREIEAARARFDPENPKRLLVSGKFWNRPSGGPNENRWIVFNGTFFLDGKGGKGSVEFHAEAAD
jgi:hypothetical protein